MLTIRLPQTQCILSSIIVIVSYSCVWMFIQSAKLSQTATNRNLHDVFSPPTVPKQNLYPTAPRAPQSVLDVVVRKLLPPQQAESYIQQHPGNQFRFYLYDNLIDEYTWQNVSNCIDTHYGQPSNCDWGSSICTEVNTTSGHYSKRRFNRNGDVVVAKLLDEYHGQYRTSDPEQADLFIVPYPSAGNCECRRRRGPISSYRCEKMIKEEEMEEKLLSQLDFFDDDRQYQHLFLSSNIWNDMHSLFRNLTRIPLSTTVGHHNYKLDQNCGRLVLPYVNTNPENQPSVLRNNLQFDDQHREYALTAFLSKKIEGNGRDRRDFFEMMENETELAGRPVFVAGLGGRRTITGEASIQDMYRRSIFCPCLRGDAPPQKRLFDAILNGCIPVVMEHNKSKEDGIPSHFAAGGISIRQTYPFAKGSFFNALDMGVDMRDIVVTIPAACGMKCMLPALHQLLLYDTDVLREKQNNLTRYASLFSYGMEENGSLQYADAVATMLVQARHFVNSQRIHLSNTNQSTTVG